MPDGCDVSQFQGDLDPEFFTEWDFVIIRAYDRHGNLDTRFAQNWTNAEGRTLRGAYGWPKPGADNRALGQALAAVAHDAELGLWADVEHSQYGLASADETEQYLDGCATPHVGVYANVYGLPRSARLDGVPWWIANYGDPAIRDGSRLPFWPHEPQRPWAIHQFTSLGRPEGLDLNYAPTLDLWGSSMRNPIYPAAVWMPGQNAGYKAGRTNVRSVVCHFTVGRNSTGIGLQGYYQFQVNRDGTVFQFAETDAVAFHAGSPWNGYGPGIEVEYLPGVDDDLWTPEQRDAVAHLCQWLHDEWGVPFDFYDGPRISSHVGFITHRSLVQTGDQHSDWWPELPRVSDSQPPEDDDVKGIFLIAPDETDPEEKGKVWFFNNGVRTYARSPEYLNMTHFFGQAVDNVAHEVTKAQLDAIPIWDPQ